ncbi:type 2 lanthipeptide synthetase LanM family protein [Actinokineospora diospyrosa]|uniref:Type 2 lantibiotic biosynthesis protein LanM n=1 Tax=Actinokineospora diospyrosa TaxID=103728 RepID=A0ABT1IN92_9PSEU|nr:type 2 lanthipeptide synthetase LanM family protein [Actinokineospora diospyrosa]MCP2274133.1 type 2 lantibiotic biosynthesis protein LanM [Actinokineospora diospyrosa]
MRQAAEPSTRRSADLFAPDWWHEAAPGQVDRPLWVVVVEAATEAVAPAPVPDDWRRALALPLLPLVATTRCAVTDALREQDVDTDAVGVAFADWLANHLTRLAARAMVEALRDQRDRLVGGTGTERFADFVRGLCTPSGLAAFFGTYPGLARLLAQTSGAVEDATVEMLTRFTRDRADIVRDLLGGTDPGPVTGLRPRLGDPHGGGRAVARLDFADGRAVIYRPRGVRAQVVLGQFTDLLNDHVPDLGLRALATVARADCGWVEHVSATPLADLDAADLFYRRQGAQLALLHLLHATDMHHQNVIACGDQPVLVDVETLLHPSLAQPDTGCPAAATLADSVQRTALLPTVAVGADGAIDISGIGAGRGGFWPGTVVDWADPGTDAMRPVRVRAEFTGGDNRPRLAGRDLDPVEHEPALVAGFRLAYDAVLRHRADYVRLLTACADLPVRVVPRPTQAYAALLAESTDPAALRRSRDWAFTAPGLNPAERAELIAGDVPLFTCRAGGGELEAGDGTVISGVVARTGLDSALDKVAAMSETDRRDQAWIISATLATRRGDADGHRQAPSSGALSGTAADPERLLAAACGLGDQLIASSQAGRGRVNWLGLELVDDRQWLVLPMGASLGSGYLGVALFLAQLAETSGISRYREVAAEAITGVPRLFDTLADAPGLVTAIGGGAQQGLGGIAYALARLARLLEDNDVRDWAAHAVGLTAHAATPGDPHGWDAGTAGCLAAMLAVHTELGLPEAARVGATRAATLQRYLAVVDEPQGVGFADGAAGMALALTRFANWVPPGETADAAAEAARQVLTTAVAAAPGALGWCHGAAGIAVGVAAAGAGCDVLGALTDTARPVPRDLGLCHGESGVVEALLVLTSAGLCPRPVLRARTALLLDALERHGPVCATPGGITTPGLLRGVAGVGYGLLRSAFADRVPSALSLEPAAAGKR